MQDPWSLYWQSDCLERCVATQSTQDVLVIARFWEKLALQLHAAAQVLDVATGNGAVPATLLKANSKLGITAVDKAKIDPLRFLSAPGALIGVNFQADVDICTLPFEGAVLDAVTSQFGIEYAGREAFTEAARSLLTPRETTPLPMTIALGIRGRLIVLI